MEITQIPKYPANSDQGRKEITRESINAIRNSNVGVMAIVHKKIKKKTETNYSFEHLLVC